MSLIKIALGTSTETTLPIMALPPPGEVGNNDPNMTEAPLPAMRNIFKKSPMSMAGLKPGPFNLNPGQYADWGVWAKR